jgi:hypothetical protein
MPCKKCGSEHQTEFDAEMNVHFPGPGSRDKQAVLLNPKLLVCLDCGFTELTIPRKELPSLAKGVGEANRVS